MFIEIEQLPTEPLRFQHVYGIGDLGFDHPGAELEEPVSTEFVLTHKDRDLRIEGTVRASIRFQCSRCLREFSRRLDARFRVLYLPQPDWKEDEEIELKYEDMEVGYYDGIRLDVDLMVLEQIELAIPMKPVCRNDCKGLCPNCGADLNQGACSCKEENVDPRFAALRDFRSKMKH